ARAGRVESIARRRSRLPWRPGRTGRTPSSRLQGTKRRKASQVHFLCLIAWPAGAILPEEVPYGHSISSQLKEDLHERSCGCCDRTPCQRSRAVARARSLGRLGGEYDNYRRL